MVTEAESLLAEQLHVIDTIRRVMINFKKLAKSNVTAPTVRSRLSTLEKLWTACQALDVKLGLIIPREEQKTLPYYLNGEFLLTEEVYTETSDLLHNTLSRLTDPPSTSLSNRTDQSIAFDSNNRHTQLPRITLPKFSGKLTEWESFRNIFESLVANNETLSNTQRFHYLKTSLNGAAARLIDNLKISDVNYGSAWQLLNDEYDDKKALVHSHLHAFCELPVMKTENINDLRELRDAVSSSLAALKNLDRPVDKWDDLLVYIISKKFSPRTRSEWNLLRGRSTELPSYKDINEFLTLRIRGLSDPSDSLKETRVSKDNKPRFSVNNVASTACACCSGSHFIAKCENFLLKSILERNDFVRNTKLCFNCLRPGHFPSKCTSKYRCSQCKRSHHTLLHNANYGNFDVSKNSVVTTTPSASASSSNTSVAIVQTATPPSEDPPSVLLATAWVDLHTVEGRSFKVRALLDQGSTSSFISESLCQTLRTKRQRADLRIKCFGEKYTGLAKSRVSLKLAPCSKSEPKLPFTPYVFQRITSYAASRIQPLESWPHLQGLHYADPEPSSRHQIHLLIGADLYGSLLLRGLRQGPQGTPTAQLTVLGWVISGPTGRGSIESEHTASCNHVSGQDTNSLLQKFWEDEEVYRPPPLTEEEERCERHFLDTHSRDSEGRYIVRLPFRHDFPPEIGDSLPIATSLYTKMETRLSQREDILVPYHDFLNEYRSLGHMIQVDPREKTVVKPVYIPHHPVLRESSCTTKLRVVFNASCKTKNGSSLNDHLLVGPKLQQDLPAVLLRWRQWRLVYIADIAKMFRQILIHPSDTDFQRIVWRPTPEASLEHFRLLTVTYGLAPAPYLAMRVLKQLSLDEGSNYPTAASVLSKSIYVDDVLFGADDDKTLVSCRVQLMELLEKGGFHLRKWASNSQELLLDLSTGHTDMTDHLLLQDETLKVLGISWSPSEDAFRFVVNTSFSAETTKRSILSFVAKLYDPLGWAAPVVIVAKILLQELWLLKSDWDTSLPEELRQRWRKYCLDIEALNSVRIPRWTGRHRNNYSIEIHGFADASNRAYAAVVYLRVLNSSSDIQVCLLTAKTKVAPIKTLSIPRLELNAVVLLSRLMKWALEVLDSPPTSIFGWSDSSVVLAWLRQHPSKWNTFVANRVSEIQTNLPSARWNHVPSKDNPADCASRGLSAFELSTNSLWWTGPSWLKKLPTSWPCHDESDFLNSDTTQQVSVEAREPVALHAESIDDWELLDKFSNWTKLVRVTAYIRRFVSRLQRKSKLRPSVSLSVEELRDAELFWLLYVQKRTFALEFKALRKNSSLSRSSPLRTLHPFIDENSLIRLGGRLKNAALHYEEQHPIILPKHRISDLLIARAHKATLHGGAQLVMRTLRQRYWILGCRGSVKTCIRHCVTCARHASLPCSQLMGNLPSARVVPSPPFEHAGVDYAGPFSITSFIGRGQKTRKSYVALFICLVTKAIHLELVEDYTSAGFLAAFKRFASRRGLPRRMYSDNGTNFHGADHELRRHFNSFKNNHELQDILASDQVGWEFIPAAAPHFGGLWEAGVKSFKKHFRRIAGSRTLSRAEFETLLCLIEACLNSRPIAPLSDDPSDLSALTPGHFLIGRPLVATPEESVLEVDPNRLSRWQLVRSMQERLWRVWSMDYLNTLQQRNKWSDTMPNLAAGDLVLVKNPLLPPSKWELARIQQIHPGSDELVRVATVRTSHSLLKRSIAQLCKLPIS